MTQDRSVDERISAWLLDEAPEQLPDRVLRATFERTYGSRQRRRFLDRRKIGMLRITPALVAVGAAAIVIAVVGVMLFPRSGPTVGGNPSPSPSASPTISTPPGSGASPAPIALGGEVAISRIVDGNTDIYLISADGSHAERLTTDPAVDGMPTWSPNGKTLLFTRTTSMDPELSDVYSIDIATHKELRLTSGGGRHAGPLMTPDGKRIVYDRSPSAPGFHVMNSDGSNDRLAYAIHDDQWTLQGSWASSTGVYAKHGDFDLLVVDIDTGSVATVVSGGAPLGDVALSPDGTTFAFRSRRGQGGVFLMDTDGTAYQPVLTTYVKGPIGWAPDGKDLILAQPDGWLWVVSLDGTTSVRWTEGISSAWRPSPSG